jgi:phage gp29-like protein
MSDEQQKNGKPVTDEVAIAAKDIDIFAGYLGRLENPDPTLLSEGRGKGLKLYDEVARDAHAGSVLQTRALSIAGLEWEVTPADDSAKAQAIAEFVKGALDNTNMTQAIQELMQAVLYGFYVAEVLWTVRDGAWVPARLITKHPRRFVFTVDRELRLLTRASMITGEPVPERKFIAFTCGSSDNPYGQGLGQSIWWPVWFKKNGIKFWLQFLDKFGSPTPKGTYPAGATQEQKDTLLEAIEAIHQETGIIVPEGMAVELLEAARSGHVSYEAMCEYMDRQISKRVLGQTLTTEVGDKGSYAASQTHEEVRDDIRTADADLLCECLNESLVRWLVDLNFPDRLYPWFSLRTDDSTDLNAQAETDRIVIKEMGLPVAVDYFYEMYGYPRPEEGAELIQPPQGAAPLFAQRWRQGSEFMAAQQETRFTPEQQALEELADKAFAGVDLAGNEAMILEAVRKASSFEEAQLNLLALFPELDMIGLQDMTERALYAAELYGRATARARARMQDDD